MISQPIALYYFGSPNSRKVTIMLEELGVPYSIVPISMSRKDQYRLDYSALSPNNKMPVIVDPEGPDGRPISVFESGAILKYLAEKHGRFYGASWAERVKIDEWLFWQVGGFGPLLGQNEHFTGGAPEPIPYAIKRFVDETRRLYGVLEGQLTRQRQDGVDFVAGSGLSIADFAIFGWARKWKELGMGEDEFPEVYRWRDAINTRPAVQRALAIAVPKPVPDPGETLATHLKLLGLR
ncbi:MAG: glutathione S-transferase N-terminal domain-containing protein [Devosia nanyangense]|uniref:Glutathione S-transferase N-terminal domain-containing protein n=1 Tax=Devosia nanyangense TaxID=1228055 RepID=A0A933L2Q0_9HYPH|nr:glutathione S-transferase N-terminal domain-containing protein [Devosia nanyangense]